MEIIPWNHKASREQAEKFPLISNNDHGLDLNIKKLKANTPFPEGMSKQLA